MTSRWKQRYTNYTQALTRLEMYIAKKTLTELEEPGFIQTFEFVSELAWNTIKDFYENQGIDAVSGTPGMQGSKDAVRLAFQRGLICDGKVWVRLIEDRNRTAHTYHAGPYMCDLIAENDIQDESLKQEIEAT